LVHTDEGDACLTLKVLSHEQHLANGSGREIGYMKFVGGTGHQFFAKDFHCDSFF
jgi:hypothetical protein